MKRMKKMLGLLLAVVMLIAVMPMQAFAASTEPMADYQQFLKNLKVLEEYAEDYAKENPGEDPVALVSAYIRAGAAEYNTGFWILITGQENTQFASYVQSREAAYNASATQKVNVTGLRNLGIAKVPNGEQVSLHRLFVVLDAYRHNDGGAHYADVAGWAGDIVDLMVQADSKGVSGTLEEMVKTVTEKHLLQEGAFSRADYAADLDGYAIAQKLESTEYTSGLIAKIISDHYDGLADADRAGGFLNGRLGGVTARGDIRNAIFESYTGNTYVATLENSKTFSEDSLSDLRKACCYALADHLCKLAGDYVDLNENIYYSVVDSQKVTLTPGVTHEKLTASTSDDKQIVYYLATADVSNPYVNVYMNYHDNDPSAGWGMQSVRDQAYAAEARHSDPSEPDLYIPNYNIIAAVNGAGYNMTTGEPAGLLMMEGVEYHAPDGIDHDGYGFFGILKDGSAVIGSTAEYRELKKQGLMAEGIDVFGTTLIKDGVMTLGYSASHTGARASRTAIGITRTGKVVVMTLDGRQEPISCGGSMQEIAQIMLDAGCVDAVNLDGGGSTTFLAQMPGDDDLSLVNKPSDGFERSVSASIIIVTTMPDPTALDHALINAPADYLTAGTQVQLEAVGLNAAGEEVAMPDGATWSVSNSSVASISASGLLTGLNNGKVEVRLTLKGKTVATKTLEVVVPDTVYFTQASLSVVKGETVALPVVAQYAGKPVAIRNSDLLFITGNAAGTVSGLNFTASATTSVKNVVITALLAANPAVTGAITVNLYDKGAATFDFANATGGNRQLAWLRQVSNASSEDGLNYAVVETGKPMATDYTVAFDALELPVTAAVMYAKMARSQGDNPLLQQADKISGIVTVKIALDKDLSADVSKVALTSDLFTLESAKVDSSNTLVLTLRWKTQAGPLSQENTNTVCILTGISVTPKQNAEWDAKKRLELGTSFSMEISLTLSGDTLSTGTYTAGKDSYTLINDLKNGWVYEEGGYAYYEDGVRYTGVRKVGSFYYDFGQSGINVGQTKYTGLFMEGGARRYTKDGVLTPGWYIEGDNHYYFDNNGTGYNGTVKVDEVDMRFDNGLHVGGYTGFITKSDGRVYHYTNGQKDYGWIYVGDDLYHFSTDIGVLTTGTHVSPDDEAQAKGAYYDFDADGRTLRGYFNGFGYYYWAGVPRRNDWVKNGADPDPNAWYRTNSNGHFVTDGSGKETFDLTLNGVKYKAVKIECDGVVYTFNNANGKLLKGDFVLKNGNWYYYWAGQPVNNGWFEMDGKTYYAYADGHLATGSNTIGGKTYMFTAQGALVKDGMMITAELSKGNDTMKIQLVDAKAPAQVRVALWARSVEQSATLTWYDMVKTGDGTWEVIVPMCKYGKYAPDTYEIHAYSRGATDEFLINTHVYVSKIDAKTHVFDDNVDGTCNGCGANRAELDEKVRQVVHMFRMYNPNTGEHFYTGSEVEKSNLVAVGWQYEGIGFTFPANTGDPVYRLFQPSTGEHLYTMDVAEKDKLMAEGWNYEGIAFNSAYDTEAVQHRLHNPNAKVGAYHFTFSEEEMQNLIAAGWEYQGIGWYSCWK